MRQEIRKNYEWYRMLTKKQRKQWRLNRVREGRNIQEKLNSTDSFWKFIASSFDWRFTPQGHEYWKTLSNRKY